MENHYKFIFLIIDSDGEPCYNENRRIMRSFMNSNTDIKTFFVRMNLDQTDPVRLIGDTLFCQGIEILIPGALQKTLMAMEYCLANMSFDYLVRTNISSFWNFKELLHMGTTFPREGFVNGVIGEYYGINYPSGAGVIYSRDIIELFIANRNLFKMDTHEDVAFGQFLSIKNIPINNGKRHDYTSNTHNINQEIVISDLHGQHYHYRVKGSDRQYDNRIFKYLYNAIYSGMTNHYKFVFLIIDSDSESCYNENRTIIRSFMNSHPNIKTFFVRMNPDQTDPVRLIGDVLMCRGTESFIPGILEKTLTSMEYCLRNISFDFCIRTNLSSFWNFKELLHSSTTFPKEGFVSAHLGQYNETKALGTPYYGVTFPSGSGYICSRDIIELYTANRSSFIMDLPDDVAIGQFLLTKNIPINSGKRHDYTHNTHQISQDIVLNDVLHGHHYHYRVKGYDRQYDNRIFQYLYNAIYSYKSTLVTFYFNLTTLPDATDAGRPQSFYMEKGRETLKLQNPMVIFCDDTTHLSIKAIRDEEVSDQTLTKYIVRPFTDYDFYRHNWPIICANRKGVPFYVNDRNTASYFLVSMFKIIALQLAHQENFYKTPFYTWIDFGGSHVMRSFHDATMKILANPRPKISMCYIHYRGHQELEDRLQNKVQGGYCGIAAGSLTAEASYISRFYTGCMSIFYEMLTNTIGHGEEQVFNYFYDRFPELCTIYYGDYYSILTNYHGPMDDIGTIERFFINEAIHKGRRDLAKQAAKAILDANPGLDEQSSIRLKNVCSS
uniref:Uncharacterized protein n=1 Tax=viral metagenome TaxID=1070528 RepID=A0A6C0AQ00_9ZZZZ